VRASQAGSSDYEAASVVDRSFTVAKATQTVSLSLSRTAGTYADSAVTTVSSSATSGLPVGLSLKVGSPCELDETKTPVELVVTGAGTYVDKADQAITFEQPAGKTFGDAPFALVASANSGLPVSFTTANSNICTVSGATLAVVGAGTCEVKASQAGNGNFNSAPDQTRSFTVAKAQQAITFGALEDKTFGDSDFAVSATASSGGAVSFSADGPCTVAGTTVSITGAGECTITAAQGGTSNYLPAASVSRAFTVARKAQAITFASLGAKTYGDDAFTVGATSDSGLPVAFSSTTPDFCTVSGTTVTLTHAGSCTVRASQAGTTNYLPATPVDQTFQIAKASQVITFGRRRRGPRTTRRRRWWTGRSRSRRRRRRCRCR